MATLVIPPKPLKFSQTGAFFPPNFPSVQLTDDDVVVHGAAEC